MLPIALLVSITPDEVKNLYSTCFSVLPHPLLHYACMYSGRRVIALSVGTKTNRLRTLAFFVAIYRSQMKK